MPSVLAALRPEVDDVVGALDHLGVVLDDDDAVARSNQVLEGLEQVPRHPGVEPHGGLVEDKERIADLFQPEMAGELDALGLASGERVDGLAQPQVAESDLDERRRAFWIFVCPSKNSIASSAVISRMSSMPLPRCLTSRTSSLKRLPSHCGQVR